MRVFWICLVAALIVAAAYVTYRHAGHSGSYVAVVARGNGLYAKGDIAGAADSYARAEQMAPESVDIALNLALANLRLGRNHEAIAAAQAALSLDRNSPAAYYLIGCADMHLLEWDGAIRAFEQSQDIAPRIAAVSFQLGLAHAQLGQTDAALRAFQAAVTYDPSHTAAHFRLALLYRKAGRTADAQAEMKAVQDLLAKGGTAQPDPAALEACVYTQPRAPFILDEPAQEGIPVRFVDATEETFGPAAASCGGPIAVVDYAHDGRNSLWLRTAAGRFQLLDNRAGHFTPLGRAMPANPRGDYRQSLVGDLDDSGSDDIVVLGKNDSRVFRVNAKGRATDMTAFARLSRLRASSGLLADLDFTGNLDLVVVRPDGAGLQAYRNLGNFAFVDATAELDLSAPLSGSQAVDEEDWGNDGLPTLFVSRRGAAPAFFGEHRGTGFTRGAVSDAWPAARALAGGDLNNDLETDAVVAGDDDVAVYLSGRKEPVRLPLSGFAVTGLLLTDYDNDGWLDILAYGPGGIRAWRNEGHAGFAEVTDAIGLSRVGPVSALAAADFSGQGAEDLIAVTPTGLRFLRNQGGAANHLLKLALTGTRSNASAIGTRIELDAGRWRTSRTVHALPVEIGTGSHERIDSLTVHWTDVTIATPDVPVGPQAYALVEPKLPTGSCPYLYAWDGTRFRFVTDVLGAAPLGLPVSLSRLVPANPRELLALGDSRHFPPRAGSYELRLTDELREILYLDQARLVAADHPVGTLVASTSKLLEGPPFPAPDLWTLKPLRPPLRAWRSDGLDVTDALAAVDGRMAGPVALRRPQMRGYARPYAITMDFGPLDVHRPLVLMLTGWLQFGGGMANIAASFDSDVGPPFPRLEDQLPDGSWRPVDTDVGAPCGKTKTILVDLAGRLPQGARRLRLTTGFEIYWDAALLCERLPERAHAYAVEPSQADLHWRGFSRYEPETPGHPLTPDYRLVSGTAPWDFTPEGWCTRYGDVRPLIDTEDDKLAILNGGDEVALAFSAANLPPVPGGEVRDFFLYLSGWDKDADFHVRRGSEVGPLPVHGMDDQTYGAEPQAKGPGAAWKKEFNTRWVGPAVLARAPAPNL